MNKTPIWLKTYLAFYNSSYSGGMLIGVGSGCVIGRVLPNNLSGHWVVPICIVLTFLGDRVAKQAPS